MQRTLPSFVFCLLLSISSYSQFLGVTALLESGPPEDKINIVFLGDGFTAAEQDIYDAKVLTAVQAFCNTSPYNAISCAYNIYKVNVESEESGIDIPSEDECSGSPLDAPQERETALGTTYCSALGLFRCIGTNDMALVTNMAANAPGNDQIILVLVNETDHGGCRFGDVTFSGIRTGFENTVLHELSHALGPLDDEYVDLENDFSETETSTRENVTTISDRATTKWSELILADTAIPTRNCDDTGISAIPADLIGLWEGASRNPCGVYRSQVNCIMRSSSSDNFCATCRRRLIRTAMPFICTPINIEFEDLLIRNDQDGWSRGKGDIYLNYTISNAAGSVSRRWPSSGDVGIGTGNTHTMNYNAGYVPTSGSSADFNIRVRDADWPDSDDKIRDDFNGSKSIPGDFTIDEDQWRLRGESTSAGLGCILDVVYIKDDQDNWAMGDGDIYIEYIISHSGQTITGRWPRSGERKMGDNTLENVGMLLGNISRPTSGDLSFSFKVMDEDSWFFGGGDDQLNNFTFSLGSTEDYGAGQVIHVKDGDDSRLTFTVFGSE